ncbi:hypothetical protein I5M32_16405 [Pedobacter sp. SD-b]|uniref:Lipoprotein n=1 Tax=Pedobacter segetis TaxID=2793069 RepID=A0ABS1BNS5_9SPHI|nr:hypothetical protein [Pedobacter segetis]MBK0384543.1 hypothetical protein [Pedobacter segetis]
MKAKLIQTCFLLTSAFFSCQTTDIKSNNYQEKITLALNEEKKPTIEQSCNYSSEKDTLKQALFPFSFKNFETQKMLKFFSVGTKVDSSKLEFAGEDYEYRIYTFKKENSFISFQVKPKSEWFYIQECVIQNDILNFKNGLKIGMNKNEISNILNIQKPNCDTIKFDLGELSTYYDFIFKNAKLEKVTIIGDE